MKYYVDSKGVVHEEPLRFAPERKGVIKRALDLGTILGVALNEIGLGDSKVNFDYMIEVFGNGENILLFTKTPLSASEPLVKKANLASSQAEYKYTNEKEKELLSSVYATKADGKTEWWLLSAEKIIFERNCYDNKYIKIRHSAVPYANFIKNLDSISISKAKVEELSSIKVRTERLPLNKWQFISGNARNYHNPAEVISYAFKKDSEFTETFKKLLNSVALQCNVSGNDTCSNVKNRYLEREWTRIDKIYPSYLIIKKHLKKEYEDLRCVNYRKNIINITTVTYGIQRVMVSGTEKEPIFLINGNTYETLPDFITALDNKSCYEETEWFESIREYVDRYIESCYCKYLPKYDGEELKWRNKRRKDKKHGRKRKENIKRAFGRSV